MASIEEKDKKPEMNIASEWGEAEPSLDKSVNKEVNEREAAPAEEKNVRQPAEQPAEKITEILPEKRIEAAEKRAEEIPSEPEKVETEAPKPGAIPAGIGQIPAAPAKSEIQAEIEGILMENLEDIFNSLSEYQKKQFKAKQEETASKIERLVKAFKVKIKEVVSLIREFLRIIPGLNKFFLEQEAKIKTDKILALKEKAERK